MSETPRPNALGWLVLGGIGAWLFSALRSKAAPNIVWVPVRRGGVVDAALRAAYDRTQKLPTTSKMPDPEYWDADTGQWWFLTQGAWYPYKPPDPTAVDVEPLENVRA